MGIRQNRSDRGTRHQLLRPEPLTLSLNSILQQRSEPYRIRGSMSMSMRHR